MPESLRGYESSNGKAQVAVLKNNFHKLIEIVNNHHQK